jgi:hypothetical protein
MKLDVPREENAVERPILFRVAGSSGRHLGQARDLVGAVGIASRSRRRSESHHSFAIAAIYADGTEQLLPPEQYCHTKEVTRDDAQRYIKRRDEGIQMAKERDLSDGQVEALLGEQVKRCDPDDPEEKQIQDYINKAPEAWRSTEELRAQEAKIFRIVRSGKKTRKAGLVFSM